MRYAVRLILITIVAGSVVVSAPAPVEDDCCHQPVQVLRPLSPHLEWERLTLVGREYRSRAVAGEGALIVFPGNDIADQLPPPRNGRTFWGPIAKRFLQPVRGLQIWTLTPRVQPSPTGTAAQAAAANARAVGDTVFYSVWGPPPYGKVETRDVANRTRTRASTPYHVWVTNTWYFDDAILHFFDDTSHADTDTPPIRALPEPYLFVHRETDLAVDATEIARFPELRAPWPHATRDGGRLGTRPTARLNGGKGFLHTGSAAAALIGPGRRVRYAWSAVAPWLSVDDSVAPPRPNIQDIPGLLVPSPDLTVTVLEDERVEVFYQTVDAVSVPPKVSGNRYMSVRIHNLYPASFYVTYLEGLEDHNAGFSAVVEPVSGRSSDPTDSQTAGSTFKAVNELYSRGLYELSVWTFTPLDGDTAAQDPSHIPPAEVDRYLTEDLLPHPTRDPLTGTAFADWGWRRLHTERIQLHIVARIHADIQTE